MIIHPQVKSVFRRGDLASVLEYYQSLSPGRLMVLGEPGAGKTVLVMELVIRLLEARLHDTGMPVPVLISAAAYESRLEWGNWLAQHLAERFSIGDEAAARLVRDGRILPVVDGVDEMDRAGESQRARAHVSLSASPFACAASGPARACRRAASARSSSVNSPDHLGCPISCSSVSSGRPRRTSHGVTTSM